MFWELYVEKTSVKLQHDADKFRGVTTFTGSHMEVCFEVGTFKEVLSEKLIKSPSSVVKYVYFRRFGHTALVLDASDETVNYIIYICVQITVTNGNQDGIHNKWCHNGIVWHDVIVGTPSLLHFGGKNSHFGRKMAIIP